MNYLRTNAKKVIPFLTKAHENLKAVSAKRPEIFMYGFFILLLLSFSQEARMSARIDAVENSIPDISEAEYDDYELRSLISDVDSRVDDMESNINDLESRVNDAEMAVLEIGDLKEEVDEVQGKLGIFDLD